MASAAEELAASASQTIQLVRNTRARNDRPWAHDALGRRVKIRIETSNWSSESELGGNDKHGDGDEHVGPCPQGQASMPQALLPHWRLRMPRPQGAARGADIVFVHSGQRPRRRHAPKENQQLREHCHARSDLLASPDHAIGSNHKTFALEDLSVQSNRRAILAHGTCRRII